MDIKKILKHLAFAVGIALVLLLGSMFLLNIGTMHNKEISVPDFYNMTIPEAEQLAKKANVRLDVVDSVYVKKMTKGAVFKQNPLADSKVKKGRRILITINAVSTKKVVVPNLVGYSLRQAIADLQSRGLTLGRLIYRSDMATDNVLGQQRGGKPITSGTKVETGTAIDLVVGLNSSDYTSLVPKLDGMTYMTAVDAIHGNSLNVGRIICDTSIVSYSDSLRSVVYMQKPNAQYRISKGSPVTIYLTKHPELYKPAKSSKKSTTKSKNK